MFFGKGLWVYGCGAKENVLGARKDFFVCVRKVFICAISTPQILLPTISKMPYARVERVKFFSELSRFSFSDFDIEKKMMMDEVGDRSR